MRDMLFVSHANPEDNAFARWLTLRLAADGYPVWCDLTKFLGGEDFWTNAETAIRTRTCKFLYVLSRTSNTKDGPRNELQVAVNVAKANKLADFIIPVHIDDLPYGEINVLLTKLIAIPCEAGWAKGYQQLLDNLERAGVPKKATFGPEAVTSWWRQQFSSERGVSEKTEKYLSNWYPIRAVPALHLTPYRDQPLACWSRKRRCLTRTSWTDSIWLHLHPPRTWRASWVHLFQFTRHIRSRTKIC